MKIKRQSPQRLPRVSGFKSSNLSVLARQSSLGGVISGSGESPTFPWVSLAGASLCLLFSNFRFGMAETGSISHEDRFSRRPSGCRARLWKRVRVSVAFLFIVFRHRFETMGRYRRPMVPAPRLLRPLAPTRVDFLDRRRVPFTRQRIALWRIEPHGQVEGSPWRWKPICFHVRAGTLVLEINIERTIRVILKRHPAADREPVALICNLKTVRIIVRDRPERFDGRSLPLSAAE